MQSMESSYSERLAAMLLAAGRFIVLLPIRIAGKLATWRRNAMYMRELERMDPRLLKDVGFRRDEVIEAIREGRAAIPMTEEERLEEARRQRKRRIRSSRQGGYVKGAVASKAGESA